MGVYRRRVSVRERVRVRGEWSGVVVQEVQARGSQKPSRGNLLAGGSAGIGQCASGGISTLRDLGGQDRVTATVENREGSARHEAGRHAASLHQNSTDIGDSPGRPLPLLESPSLEAAFNRPSPADCVKLACTSPIAPPQRTSAPPRRGDARDKQRFAAVWGLSRRRRERRDIRAGQ